ncbi:MAG: hypothetical protein LBU73_00970 [Helicobacteraceae bacterium]|jgi:tRNA U34 5-methylaminomethyl-2-thiouridine-forming methyltransferase MnmC|nr:hypothetical protein [Helicobacteraceae bacterium]
MNFVKTADGAHTLYSDRFGEHYHSVQEGALIESFEKHARPAIGIVGFEDKAEINVLDICFGLGYKSLCLINELERLSFKGKINIISLENDRELLAKLAKFEYPSELAIYSKIISEIAKNFCYEDKKVSMQIIINRAERAVKLMEESFDIMFQDPFSVLKTPELWSEEFFKDLYNLLRDDGVITTYSASELVRKRMKSAGFYLYAHNFTAKQKELRKGTIAVKTKLIGKDRICLPV